MPANRLKAAQLLVSVLWSGEEHITQYADQLMRALCRAASDEAAAVRRCAAEAGRIGARVLEPDVWLRLALPNLRAGQLVVGHLFALAALVNGTRGDRLLRAATATATSTESGAATSDKAQTRTTPAQILDALSSEDVLLSQQAPQQEQLLAVVDALLVSLADRADLFSFEVFTRTKILSI